MNRDNYRKIIAVATALGITTGLSGCAVNKTNNMGSVPERKIVDKELMNNNALVENHSSFTISNGNVIKVYKACDIYYFVNRETNEIGEYLYYPAASSNEEDYGHVVYDINKEEYVFYLLSTTAINYDYYEYLQDNFYFVPLTTVIDSLDNVKLKEYYSIDEINEIKEYVKNDEVIKTKSL